MAAGSAEHATSEPSGQQQNTAAETPLASIEMNNLNNMSNISISNINMDIDSGMNMNMEMIPHMPLNMAEIQDMHDLPMDMSNDMAPEMRLGMNIGIGMDLHLGLSTATSRSATEPTEATLENSTRIGADVNSISDSNQIRNLPTNDQQMTQDNNINEQKQLIKIEPVAESSINATSNTTSNTSMEANSTSNLTKIHHMGLSTNQQPVNHEQSMLSTPAMTRIEEETETVHLDPSPEQLQKHNTLLSPTKTSQTTSVGKNSAPNEDNSLQQQLMQVQVQMQAQTPNKDQTQLTELHDVTDHQKIQAYAMLDFDSFTFYVQTMQILLGRMVEGDSSTDGLDIHLGNQKAISRRHAKMFYNFGNQRFELSVLGRNGAFVDGNFVEKGITVPLSDGTKIQIGETEFAFVLPSKEKGKESEVDTKASGKSDIPEPVTITTAINKKPEEEEKGLLGTASPSKVKPKPKPKSKPKAPVAKPQVKIEEESPIKLETNDKAVEKDPLHIENLDSLVANFDEFRKDIHNDEVLLTKDPAVLNIVFDPDNERRELEIEKEIGKVLARENSAQAEEAQKAKKTSKTKNEPEMIIGEDGKPKPKPKKVSKSKKKVYTLEEIPEQYRTKPNLPYSILITDCLRQKGTERGMSLSEIYKGIQDLYPYYFYCPDGWQSSVRHNLSLNKSFRKISKEGKGWLWGVNEEVVAEKDRARQKQLENAKAKGKSLPRPVPKALQLHTPSGGKVPLISTGSSKPAIQMSNNNIITSDSIALQGSTPLPGIQIHQHQPPQQTSAQTQAKAKSKSTTTSSSSKPAAKTDTMNANTKRALAYLQQELISLTKSRKMYDRATSTEILTKALAMTISQVDQAAKNFAIKGFPLVTLIDKNPGHVTKILTAALNAATLQVCKAKGLTPHLPPRNTQSPSPAMTSKPASTQASKPVQPGKPPQPSAQSTSASPKPPPVKPLASKPVQQPAQLQQQQHTSQSVQSKPQPPMQHIQPKTATASKPVDPAPLVQNTEKPASTSYTFVKPEPAIQDQSNTQNTSSNVSAASVAGSTQSSVRILPKPPVTHSATSNPAVRSDTPPSNGPIFHQSPAATTPSLVKQEAMTISPSPPVTTQQTQAQAQTQAQTLVQPADETRSTSTTPQPSSVPSAHAVVPKPPGAGPVFHNSQQSVHVKPTFKPSAPSKPSFKPSVKPIVGTVKPFGTPPSLGKPPVKLNMGNSNNGNGIVKPQFYAKGKPPQYGGSSNSNLSAKSDDAVEDEEIKRSIEKFGKPTLKPFVKPLNPLPAPVSATAVTVVKPPMQFATTVSAPQTVPSSESPTLNTDATVAQQLDVTIPENVKTSSIETEVTVPTTVGAPTLRVSESAASLEKESTEVAPVVDAAPADSLAADENTVSSSTEVTEEVPEEDTGADNSVADTTDVAVAAAAGDTSKADESRADDGEDDEDELQMMLANLEHDDEDDEDDENDDEDDEEEGHGKSAHEADVMQSQKRPIDEVSNSESASAEHEEKRAKIE
jgi:hypothetical protein